MANYYYRYLDEIGGGRKFFFDKDQVGWLVGNFGWHFQFDIFLFGQKEKMKKKKRKKIEKNQQLKN